MPERVREVPFSLIEDQFELAPLVLSGGIPASPAVMFKQGVGWSIRVRTRMSYDGRGRRSESFDYFRVGLDGEILAAPRGYAKDFKPGRIPVAELEAAIVKYAEAAG
jgi:hypothetical protein